MKRHRNKNTMAKKQISMELERLYLFSNGLDDAIYVIDPQTYKVLFANDKAKEIFGENIEAKKCFRVFQKLSKPCSFCNNKKIFGKNLGKTDFRIIQSKRTNHWYRCMDKAIMWPKGEYVRYGTAVDVTEQKEMKEALNESEEIFRSVVEDSLTAILILDDEFRVIYCNDEAANLGGYSREELIGHDFRGFLDETSKILVQSRYLRRREGKTAPSQYEFKLVRKNGEVRNVEARASLMKYSDGRARTLAQLIDITEHKRIEKERKHFEERLSAINTYAHSLNTAKSMDEIYKLTLDASEKTLGFKIANILIIQGKRLCLVAQRGHPHKLTLELPLDGKKGITVRAARKGKTVYVPDVREDKAYTVAFITERRGNRMVRRRRSRGGILSELAVPIKTGRKVLGVLNVENKKLAGFDGEDKKLLEILSSHAATAVSNLRRQAQLKEFSKKLEYLMNSTAEIMNANEMHKRLNVIAKALKRFGWRRVVISLRDENLEGTELVATGLTRKEKRILLERKAPGQVWKERLGPKFEPYKIDKFYYLPWSDPWVRENVHGVPRETSEEEVTTYAGVPSNRSMEEMIDWHPQDMLYAPLRAPSGKIVGILSMDDPADGKMPTKESLAPLELFLHQAATVIENAQLIESLREAREQLERKVDERTQELKKSQEQLLKAQRLAVIGELAGMVGHDLRNPLTSIAGAAYYLKKRPNLQTESKVLEMLQLIENNISYSNKIINDLLDYSKEVRLDLTESNPKAIVKESLSLVQRLKNIRIVDLTRNDHKIIVDVEKLKRAFVNLIKNGLDAMPRGGTLTIACRKSDRTVEFTISDTGVGMKKETLSNLWTPLFTTKAKGMGFGLPICKRIIDAHGGKISVKTAPGKGTTFTVTIPIQPNVENGGEEIWTKTLESSLLMTTRT